MKKKRNGGKQPKYSDAYKTQIALEYLNTEKTYEEVAKHFGAKVSLVSQSVQYYRRAQKLREASLLPEESPSSPEPAPDQSSELAQLRNQVSELLMRLDASETMIDTAEEEFNISIRKKSGSRRSKK